jgi:hypothetical protein
MGLVTGEASSWVQASPLIKYQDEKLLRWIMLEKVRQHNRTYKVYSSWKVHVEQTEEA